MTFAPFTFAQISDSHIKPGAEWTERAERIWKAVQAHKPAFVVHSGDLIDDPLDEAVDAFRAIYAPGALPFHCVPGNHDVWNAPVHGEGAPWWTRTTTSEDEQRFRAWFGPTAYSTIYQGCALVAFNSQLLNAELPEAKAQWDWLEQELNRLQALKVKHIFFLTHMPLFVRSPEEQPDWNDWRNGYLVIAPPGRDYLLHLIQTYGVTGYLCGHWHYPIQHSVTWAEGHTTRFVICGASGPASLMAQEHFGFAPAAIRADYNLHHVTDTGIETEFVTI